MADHADRDLHREFHETEPTGTIIEAKQPIRVRFKIQNRKGQHLNYGAWAIAWTRDQVLVQWLPEGARYPVCVWVPTTRVKRNPSRPGG